MAASVRRMYSPEDSFDDPPTVDYSARPPELRFEGRGIDDGDDDDSDAKAHSHPAAADDAYALPESTFSLLITEPPCSVPFAYAAFSVALSVACLGLALASSATKGTRHNRLGVPGGVTHFVRAAQFLGVLVGVLMEDEIPQGLQFIANGVGNELLLNGERPVRWRVVLSSAVRLLVGYLFLSSLFINVAQSDDVIEIFYDVLALEFVENIDTTAFALAKRGFFGRSMLLTAARKRTLAMPERRREAWARDGSPRCDEPRTSGLLVASGRINCFVRFIYFLNAAVVLAGMAYITVLQRNGEYRCNSLTVMFEEEIWENARVQLGDGNVEERLLIYSNFNGVYRESGSWGGYPVYVEQNKNDGSPYPLQSTVPAKIKYCTDINSWVFMHPNILTSPEENDNEENECSWLWRSGETQDFDILSTADGSWEAWAGERRPLAQVSFVCNECTERSDCNYHGTCNKQNQCVCDDSHVGDSCEFELPCSSLASEKAQRLDPEKGTLEWQQENPIRQMSRKSVYNRPVYIQKGLSGQPYDMRLYKILKPDITPSPSSQPSDKPSVSRVPTSFPSKSPSFSPSSSPTGRPSSSPTKTSLPTSTTQPTIANFRKRSYTTDQSAKAGKGRPPEPPVVEGPVSGDKPHTQIDYNYAPDFADWDDFFESTPLHDLEDILDDYSVILSYSGSRFYGTIVEPDVTFDDLFPPDYHAFWSKSFDVNRTFIISDTTASGTPVGLDFFEMRRRINTLLNPNVQFSYSPFGATIPLMSYEGAGFFHCLEETPKPSTSPSSSRYPTLSPYACIPTVINVVTDRFPLEISWSLFRVVNARTVEEENFLTERFEEYSLGDSLYSADVCLQEGEYEFGIRDTSGYARPLPAHYNLTTTTTTSYGEVIMAQGDFGRSKTISFSLPWNPVPSASPYPSSSPTNQCWGASVNVMLDRWPEDISWNIHKIGSGSGATQGEKQLVQRLERYEGWQASKLQSHDVCLQKGEYQFTIIDSHGDGIRPNTGYYNMLASNGEVIFLGEWFRKRKTYSFSIPVLSKPSLMPSISQAPSSSLAPTPTGCTDTPGFVDIDSNGCEHYDTYTWDCFDNGNVGEAGMTPNENCCACIGILEDWELPDPPGFPGPGSPTGCIDTPGFVDVDSNGCEHYETYPWDCFENGDVGEAGMTPNENCCACIDILEDWELPNPPGLPGPGLPGLGLPGPPLPFP